jgi:hypothetical protein
MVLTMARLKKDNSDIKSGPMKNNKTGIDNKVANRRQNLVRRVIKNSKATTEPVTKGLPSTKSEQFKTRMNPDTRKLINKALKVNPKSKNEIANFRNNLMKKGF